MLPLNFSVEALSLSSASESPESQVGWVPSPLPVTAKIDVPSDAIPAGDQI